MSNKKKQSKSFFIRFLWAILFFASAYALWVEHEEHVRQYLPTLALFLVILLCPLMHFFMHKNHSDHDEDKKQ